MHEGEAHIHFYGFVESGRYCGCECCQRTCAATTSFDFKRRVVQSFPGIRLLIVVDTLGVHFVTLKNVSLVASSLFRKIYAPLAARGRRWFTFPSVCTDRWCPFQGQGHRHAAEECLLRIQRKDATVHRRQPTVGVSHQQNIVEVIAAPLVVLRQVLAVHSAV